MDPGVEVLVLAYSLVVTLALLTCIAEFGSGMRSQFGRWLEAAPVSRPLQEILVRAPTQAVLGVAALVVAPPAWAYLRSQTDASPLFVGLGLVLLLLAGPVSVLPIVWLAQVLTNHRRIGRYYAGVLMVLWMVWAVVGGLALRRSMKLGIFEGLGAVESALVWPGVVRSLLTGEVVPMITAGIGLVALVCLSALAASRLRPLKDLADDVALDRSSTLARFSLPALLQIRTWRSRRSRGYIVAGSAASILLLSVATQQDSPSEMSELGILAVALFGAGYVTVARGVHGRVPAERLLFAVEPISWGRAWLLAGPLAAFFACALPVAAFGFLAGSAVVAMRGLMLVALGVGIGASVGSRRVPQQGDASAEMICSALFLSLIMIAGAVADAAGSWSSLVQVLTMGSIAIAGLVDSVRLELHRPFTITPHRESMRPATKRLEAK
jgi:hypothetical protein